MTGFVDRANVLREQIAEKKRERDSFDRGDIKFVNINDDGQHHTVASIVENLDAQIEALEIELLKLGG